jgi:hypothetical protein
MPTPTPTQVELIFLLTNTSQLSDFEDVLTVVEKGGGEILEEIINEAVQFWAFLANVLVSQVTELASLPNVEGFYPNTNGTSNSAVRITPTFTSISDQDKITTALTTPTPALNCKGTGIKNYQKRDIQNPADFAARIGKVQDTETDPGSPYHLNWLNHGSLKVALTGSCMYTYNS